MKCKKFLSAVGMAAMILGSIPMLAVGAEAQSYKTLYSFKGGSDGSFPRAPLTLDPAGNLYGTTQYSTSDGGTGKVFELIPNSNGGWKEKVLYLFSGYTDGDDPFAGVILDQAGNLYGTTYDGGVNGGGNVFELTPGPKGSWTETTLYSFGCPETPCSDGDVLTGGLVSDQAGNLYGTTILGGDLIYCTYGTYGCGVVFKLAPNPDGSWSESVLHVFCSLPNCEDGSNPWAGLIFDGAGNLYGTTTAGGVYGQGTVFKLTAGSDGNWTESVLLSFCSLANCSDGAGPYSQVILDQAGNLYGTTLGGGNAASGIVFKLAPKSDGSWKEILLHTFCSQPNCRDGSGPWATLTLDQAGNLYGTTSGGGDGFGVVFKLAPTSKGPWHETVLRTFNDKPGAVPLAGLIFDATGHLYGTTSGDYTLNLNTTFGSVFEITP